MYRYRTARRELTTKRASNKARQLRHPALQRLDKRLPIGVPDHAAFVGYSTRRKLNGKAYTVV